MGTQDGERGATETRDRPRGGRIQRLAPRIVCLSAQCVLPKKSTEPTPIAGPKTSLGANGSGSPAHAATTCLSNRAIRICTIWRVEVLKGPQGSRFGSSAIAGAIRYVTQRPNLEQYAGRVNTDYSKVDGGGDSIRRAVDRFVLDNFGLPAEILGCLPLSPDHVTCDHTRNKAQQLSLARLVNNINRMDDDILRFNGVGEIVGDINAFTIADPSFVAAAKLLAATVGARTSTR